MCTYGEGKINESYETHLVAGFCFRLSPPGSMGLTGLQCSVLCVVWISLLSQHEHKSVSLYLYQSSLSSYYIVCRECFFFFFLAPKVGMSEVLKQMPLCVSFLWNQGFSEATGRKSECFHAVKTVIGVIDKQEVETGDTHLNHWQKASQRTRQIPQHLGLISTGR